MPFINSKVSVPLTDSEKETLKGKLGQAISLIPGKSESWLMVGFEMCIRDRLRDGHQCPGEQLLETGWHN